MTQLFIILFSVFLGVLRTMGVTHPTYQAIAHMWVGGLFASAWTEFRSKGDPFSIKLKFYSGTALSILELICFIVFHFMSH